MGETWIITINSEKTRIFKQMDGWPKLELILEFICERDHLVNQYLGSVAHYLENKRREGSFVWLLIVGSPRAQCILRQNMTQQLSGCIVDKKSQISYTFIRFERSKRVKGVL